MTTTDPKTIWVNIYCPGSIPKHLIGQRNPYPEPVLGSLGHDSKKKADSHAAPNRIACVAITFVEGEGL